MNCPECENELDINYSCPECGREWGSVIAVINRMMEIARQGLPEIYATIAEAESNSDIGEMRDATFLAISALIQMDNAYKSLLEELTNGIKPDWY